jgi:hypothetical protein
MIVGRALGRLVGHGDGWGGTAPGVSDVVASGRVKLNTHGPSGGLS